MKNKITLRDVLTGLWIVTFFIIAGVVIFL
jgi:hypothetical protein